MILKVKVHAGTGTIDVKGEHVVVLTEKQMKNNMANYDVMKQISDYYHVEVNCVSILRGATRRNKLIEVRCI